MTKSIETEIWGMPCAIDHKNRKEGNEHEESIEWSR